MEPFRVAWGRVQPAIVPEVVVHELVEWGYGVIQALQLLRTPVLDSIFVALSFLGEQEFYLLLVPILYWLVDKRLATRFTILLLVTVYLNTLFKGLLGQARPSEERVAVLDDPEGGGLPSGHAQVGLVSWGFLATRYPARWFRWAMVALILAIGLSRIYLGVHFPHDVLGGWLLGGVGLYLYLALLPPLTGWFASRPLPLQIGVGAGAALLLALLYPVGHALVSSATLFGMAIAVPLERSAVRFAVRGCGGWRRLARLLGGTVILLLIWQGMKPLLEPLEEIGSFVRYALVGGWVALGAPWLFVRLGLAGQEERV